VQRTRAGHDNLAAPTLRQQLGSPIAHDAKSYRSALMINGKPATALFAFRCRPSRLSLSWFRFLVKP
jgi:hypothetical protein